MVIYTENIGVRTKGEVFSWNEDDAILYALGVGAGTDELKFTTENSEGIELQALPTMAVVLSNHKSEGKSEAPALGDFKLHQILHVGQEINMVETLPAKGSGYIESGMSAVYDKGKHAIIEIKSVLKDVNTQTAVAEMVMQMMVRGEGGFGGDPGPRNEWSVPEGEPDETTSFNIPKDQALLYRLNGDRNPLHSDPIAAGKVGFEAPILHGLCTWGYSARALLKLVAENDVSKFGRFSGRFLSPVYPGGTLDVHVWHTENGARYRTSVNGTVVLDRGEFSLR